jgi:UDP-N-acetylglucosamine transferase subunit ALG13
MLFVTAGSQKFPMNRLFREIDIMIERGDISCEVFAQTGNSDYTPRLYPYAKFLENTTFQAKIAACDILVCHSGVATIADGLRMGKPIIVCPRLKRYGEHVDDHQLEIAHAYENKGYVLCCADMEALPDKIAQCGSYNFKKYFSSPERVEDLILGFLGLNRY